MNSYQQLELVSENAQLKYVLAEAIKLLNSEKSAALCESYAQDVADLTLISEKLLGGKDGR